MLVIRLGDLLFVLWMRVFAVRGLFITPLLIRHTSRVLTLVLLFVIFTKRAQWPFCSWLPKAIRAPTPTSALVHRSTLVVAGFVVVLHHYGLFLVYKVARLLTLIG